MKIQATHYSRNIEQNHTSRIKTGKPFTIQENVEQQHTPVNYKELAQQYDVRNATFNEIKEISNILYNAGEISMKEHMLLIFDFGRATDYIKNIAPGTTAPHFDMYKTSANEYGQRDWIAEIEARAADHFKFGNLIGYHTNSKILAILQKLDRE